MSPSLCAFRSHPIPTLTSRAAHSCPLSWIGPRCAHSLQPADDPASARGLDFGRDQTKGEDAVPVQHWLVVHDWQSARGVLALESGSVDCTKGNYSALRDPKEKLEKDTLNSCIRVEKERCILPTMKQYVVPCSAVRT